MNYSYPLNNSIFLPVIHERPIKTSIRHICHSNCFAEILFQNFTLFFPTNSYIVWVVLSLLLRYNGQDLRIRHPSSRLWQKKVRPCGKDKRSRFPFKRRKIAPCRSSGEENSAIEFFLASSRSWPISSDRQFPKGRTESLVLISRTFFLPWCFVAVFSLNGEKCRGNEVKPTPKLAQTLIVVGWENSRGKPTTVSGLTIYMYVR